MTVFDIAMEVLTEHRNLGSTVSGPWCVCEWRWSPEEPFFKMHLATVFAERFGGVVLEPAENMALTIALAQVDRGESPPPNTAYVVVHALARFRAALALLDGEKQT